MIKRLLFIGIVVTSFVMIFIVNEASSFPHHHPVLKIEISQPVLAYCVPVSGLPLNHSGDGNATYFKATPSFSIQPSTYFIRFNQAVLCSSNTFFKTQNFEKYRLVEQSNLRGFFMTLSKVIISPNAP